MTSTEYDDLVDSLLAQALTVTEPWKQASLISKAAYWSIEADIERAWEAVWEEKRRQAHSIKP